jgi:hypothetical protein
MTDDNADTSLRDREKLRRKALGTLSLLHPGDPNAGPIIQVLENTARQDEADASIQSAIAISELRNVIEIQARTNGLKVVQELSIPEPWRERFFQASRGSTRHVNGPYLHDLQKFIALWKQKMEHLNAHRSAAK